MKPGWNRWLYLSSLLRENKLWLSNRLQPSCRKSLHMRGAMTHSSLRSLRFPHAFLFWGVLMNDLKSDLFLSLGCLGGTPLGRGRSLMGWEGPPPGKLSCLWREKKPEAPFLLFSSSHIKHRTYISFMRASAKCFFFLSLPKLWKQRSGKDGKIRGEKNGSWPSAVAVFKWRKIFTEYHTSHHSSQNLSPQLVPWN